MIHVSKNGTWYKPDNSNIINLENYNLHHTARQDRRSGGAAIYVHNSLSFRIRNDLNLIQNRTNELDHCESVFIEIILPNKKNIIVGNIYRAHRTNTVSFLHDLNACLSKISIENKPCYISGDFNFDLLKFDLNDTINDFLSKFYDHNMFPLIDRPTRITSSSATLLDNIFCNCFTHKIKSGVLISDLTDHYPIFQCTSSTLHFVRNKLPPDKSRLFNRNRLDCFTDSIKQINWDDILSFNSTVDAYNAFIHKFLLAYNFHFPIKHFRKKSSMRNVPRKPWISSAILKSINRKDNLYKRYVCNRTDNNRSAYVNYKNKLTTLIRLSKRNYYHNKLNECKYSSKQTWNVLNNILGRSTKPTGSSYFNVDNNTISDPLKIADCFNKYFSNVGPELSRSIPTVDKNLHDYLNSVTPPLNSFFFAPTDSDEIVSVCKTLKSSSSPGHDDIKPDVIKAVSILIAKPLVHIFNLSFKTGIIPHQLKLAKVIPIFKKGERESISNYRPISLLPFFSKILERLTHKRLYAFISKYNLLHKNQFGFRPKFSCEMALLSAYNHIVSNLDNRNHTIGIFLDLSKAFDTIDHEILLSKLNHYGIRGVAFEWFRNYLSNRKQFVSFNGSASTHLDTTCGVPQGSILGPLLFIIYVNDLIYLQRDSTLIMYADDTNVIISDENFNQLISKAKDVLTRISVWFKVNKLSLNVTKSNYIIFRNKYSNRNYEDIHITIDNSVITRVTHTKFLGILLDDNLSWNTHTAHIANLVSKYSGILFRLKAFLHTDILFSLYNTLVLPHIQYCCLVWADRNNSNRDLIHRKQKRIIRICTNSNFLDHTPPLFARLKTLTIFDLHSLSIATFMYKFKFKLLPEIFSSYFNTVRSFHTYRIRSSNSFRPHEFRTDLARNTIRRQGPLLWNDLPDDIVNSSSLKRFKCALKKNLISKYTH